MRPPHISNIARDMVPALEAMEAAGVGHVVLLSVMGAEDMPWVPHAKIETWLQSSSMSWTFIRPSFFMENLSGVHAPAIAQQHHRSSFPLGRARRRLWPLRTSRR